MSDISDEKIERHYGKCDVTLTFKDKAEDIKDKVLWLMLENYRARIEQKALESVATEPADKHDDS